MLIQPWYNLCRCMVGYKLWTLSYTLNSPLQSSVLKALMIALNSSRRAKRSCQIGKMRWLQSGGRWWKGRPVILYTLLFSCLRRILWGPTKNLKRQLIPWVFMDMAWFPKSRSSKGWLPTVHSSSEIIKKHLEACWLNMAKLCQVPIHRYSPILPVFGHVWWWWVVLIECEVKRTTD